MEFLYETLCECDKYHLHVGMPDDAIACECGRMVDRLDFFPLKPLSHATAEELSAIHETCSTNGARECLS